MKEDIRRIVSEQLNGIARRAVRYARETSGAATASDHIAGRAITAHAAPSTRQQRNAQERFELGITWTRDGEPTKRKALLNDLTEELANTF